MANIKVKIEETKQCLKARQVLWCLAFIGFAMNNMVRTVINIAIVSMVQSRTKSTLNIVSVENASIKFTINSTFSEDTNIPKSTETVEGFDWDEKKQGLILGAMFWLYWATQIPGGMLAKKYGPKIVFGLNNFLAILLCFVIPTAAHMGYEYLIAVRVLQGVALGFCWPAMHTMTGRWIPPNERSRFISAYLGGSLGTSLTFLVCGFIIKEWGWEPVFYVCGVIGTAWYIAWCFLVFDSPAEHPRISKEEMNYIIESLGTSVSKEEMPVPWKSIFTSIPVWLSIFAQWGGIWGLYTSNTNGPTYFKEIHGWNIQAVGMLSALPQFVRVVFALVFSQFGDYLLTTNKMNRTNVRKLATFFSCIAHGLCFVSLSFAGTNKTAAIILMTSATGFHGAISTGSLAIFVDLSPNYAGILYGLCGTIITVPGFVAPIIVGDLTLNNQTVSQWQKVFWISASMLIVPGVLFILFAKAELQPWNSSQPAKDSILESEFETVAKKGENPDDEHEIKIEEK